jgi:signal transduction histidine kinase
MPARGVGARGDRIRRVRPELWRRGGAAALAGLVVLAVLGLWVAPGEAAAPAWWQVGALTQGLAWCVVAGAAWRLPARGGPARVAAVLLFLTGTTLLVSSALLSAGASRGTFTGLVWLALAVVLPPALVDYPYGHVRAPGAYAVMTLLLVMGLVGLDPAGVVGSEVQGTGVLRGGLGTVQVAVLVAWSWWRGEHADRPTRVALLWPALGAGTCGLLAGHLVFAADPNGLPAPLMEVFFLVFWLLVPASVAVGLEASQRYDVRRLISSVAVYTAMVDLTVGVVAGSLALLTLTTGAPPTKGAVATVATAAAIAFGPALVRVRRIIEEVVFGGSTDALDTMSRLGAELGADSSPQAWVEALRSALLVPRMELRTGGELLAAAGTNGGGATETTALRAGGEHVGDLVVTVPPDAARLSRGTRAVLDLVAAPLGRALQAVHLAEELHASRGRVVQAREEERRRLRRDLHDGLGPVLTGVAYSADAAINLLASDPRRAGALLTRLREDTAHAIAEIRRIVQGLRPPALDEIGLAGALRQHSIGLSGAVQVEVRCSLPAAEGPGRLPAAIDVVAYRVAVEALTNAARHARPPRDAPFLRVLVEIAAECCGSSGDAPACGELVVTVQDDGAPEQPWVTGTGLGSMLARCDEVGGTVTAGPTPTGGRVVVRLPLGRATADNVNRPD